MAEANEFEMKTLISMEYERAHVEATKNYLSATEAVRRQSEFYTKELSELSSQRDLFTQYMKPPYDPSKSMQKQILACEVAIQTDIPIDGDEVDVSNAQSTNGFLKKDKVQVYEEEFKMLQHKHMAQKKAYDESRAQLYLELTETKKQLDDCAHVNGKVRTERDLALGEVNELRKLLSISRNALACIHEPSIHVTEVQNLHPEAALQMNRELSSLASSTHTSNFRIKERPKSHKHFAFNYQYSNHDNASESLALRRSEALVINTYSDNVSTREQSSLSKPIVEASALVLDPPPLSPSSQDNDNTYDSCEFDEESFLSLKV